MESDKNPLPKLDILPHPLKKVGAALAYLFTMHQLASHGDHVPHDTLATPVRPVTELPDNRALFAEAEQRMQDYWSGWERI